MICSSIHAHQTWHDPESTFIVVIDKETVGLSHNPEGTQVFCKTFFANLPILHMALASALSLNVPLAVDAETGHVAAGSFKSYQFLLDARFIEVETDEKEDKQYWFKMGRRIFKLYTVPKGVEDLFADAVNEAQRTGSLVKIAALQVLPRWKSEGGMITSLDVFAFEISRLSNIQAKVVLLNDIVDVETTAAAAPAQEKKPSVLKRIFSRSAKAPAPEAVPMAFSVGQRALIHQLEQNLPKGARLVCIKSRCPDKSTSAENARESCFILGLAAFQNADPVDDGPHDNNAPIETRLGFEVTSGWVL